MGNKLPLDTYSAMPARRLHTDYTDCTDSLSIDNWQMWCARIGNCVAGFHRLQCKHRCELVLIYIKLTLI